VTLENIFATIESGKAKELNVVLKTDVKGSMEVLSGTLQALSTKELKLKLIHAGIGSVNTSDIDLAIASKAVIICFNVGSEARAGVIAEDKGIQIRRYDVIYTLLEEVQAAMEGLLEPETVETVIGKLTVKEVFKTSKGNIAGCLVSQGRVERSAQVRVFHGGKKVFTGRLASLRRFKDDVREVAEGFECGVKLEGFEEVAKDDVIEAFTLEKVARKIYTKS
jgi:translation initiation factor IF-2